MAGRSLKLSPTGKKQVEQALTDKKWSTEDLAAAIGVQRATATNFRAGKKPVDRKNFVKFCEALGLDWQLVSENSLTPSESPIDQPSNPPRSEEAWIERVREHCRQRILSQHSRMRLLSGEEIGVDQLYVDVWLLNRSPRTFQVSESKLLETFDLRNDRLGLGDRIKRNPGFEIANDNSKLVILGKPGSGKTTFLKHLAVDWCKGKFQPESIAVLIELRRIRDNQWNLIEAIDQELGLRNWSRFNSLKQRIAELEETIQDLRRQKYPQDRQEERHKLEKQIKELQKQLAVLPLSSALDSGEILVLMDGLDEVPTNKLRLDIQSQLEQIARDYPKNRLVLTCRTQIMGAIPAGFTSVEVADFSEEQVQQFVQNWFIANEKSNTRALQQQENFEHALRNNVALKELITTPVLLSLICLVLQDSGEIPEQRDWLYQKGIRLLLNKWNDIKQIDGWEIGTETYQQLNIEQKEALLTEIAARKFENPENFVLFQQQEIVNYINGFLQSINLNKKIARFLGFADSREGIATLKAIEAQHGLLIERADELWSFSHLTFQEYFTIQWLTKLTSEELAEKITKEQWQKAVKQIVKSQQPADRLVQMIKRAIDRSIANEPKIQKFMAWVLQKSETIPANYEPTAIRAFYFAVSLDPVLLFNQPLSLERPLNLSLALAISLDSSISSDCALDRALDRTLNLSLNQASDTNQALSLSFNRALDLDSELANQLVKLGSLLPIAPTKDLRHWWKADGYQWTDQLRKVMIKHRNIGHDWQFTETQNEQLKSYYNLNKFLVELIKIEGAVSATVRIEIDDTLLLPWEELQRRQM